MSATALPGCTIGMLGGGQLGRMSLLAGRQLGYRFHVLEPKIPCSAGPVAEQVIAAGYDDPTALAELIREVDRVTLEFENIPSDALRFLEKSTRVYPGRHALEICQNRGREKTFLRDLGVPHAPFACIDSAEDLLSAMTWMGPDAVLKTADFGYDGKGQLRLREGMDLAAAWASFDGQSAVLEKWISFSGEYSVICGRNADGQTFSYPLIQNIHRNHILHMSVSPVQLDSRLEKEAAELAQALLEGLGLVGILAIELFLTERGWVVNEMAPRPHNSGHLTIDAHLTSQFEQHIRMVCGLPPGSIRQHSAACMLNLLGDLWEFGEPAWGDVLKDSSCKLHLYDKGAPRKGRKMGHLTFIGDFPEACRRRAEECFNRLSGGRA
jgi:5-(carboxyamino)imidazole ribonucleotide synthase